MGFGTLDYIVMAGYLLAILGMGAYFMRRQESTSEYFLGSRRMHWFPIAISMFASVLSAISYIACPAEAYNHGMTMSLKSVFVILGIPPAIYLFVRFFRGLSITTAYEYLEGRFGVSVRLTTAGLFLILRSFHLGVVLFASAVVLEPATGWPIWFSVLLVGVISTAYTTMGGISSVIWTDVLQFFVLVGGVLIVIGSVMFANSIDPVEIWNFAKEHGHTFNALGDREFYSFNPYVRLSLWGMVISSIFTKLSLAGSDQVVIQRYLSTRNEKDATRSLLWGTVLGAPVMFLLYFAGLALFWFYSVHPDRALPNMLGDHVLPHYISTELAPGVGGMIMAAIIAAVMSTVDSGLNSLATCTTVDFYKRIFKKEADDRQSLRFAKISTIAWGLLSMGSAALLIMLFGAERQQNPLIYISEVTLGFFSGILLGVFLLGVVTRRANSFGVMLGMVAGLIAALSVTAPYYFCELPPDAPRLSFFWINIIGCIATCVVGYFGSLLRGRSDKATP
ncbi:MAG: sodium/solute symporter [Kiritimatiellae bacterium]|jgi:SSS family transporter|nr:sodium/solute symporter [Kiritimatiellia bacterium]